MICTADSISTLTTSVDWTRHKNGAIVSHLDGSVSWYSVKNEAAAGRFSCGPFPLQPMVNIGGQSFLAAPANFKMYNGGAMDMIPSSQFEFCGPYGDGNGDGYPNNLVGELGVNYIGEESVIQYSADQAPNPGDMAPNPQNIYPPLAGDVPDNPAQPVHEYKNWTTVSAADATWAYLSALQNYNADFPNRTTYAVMYIFSPIKLNVPVTMYFDDAGEIG